MPVAYAAEGASESQETPLAESKKWGLIPILVDQDLLDDNTSYNHLGTSASLTELIFAFAQNVQSRTPNSAAFIVGVNKNDSPVTISRFLEKLYYEGYDSDLLDGSTFNDDLIPEDDNKLVGTILIGDIPLPVVREDDGSTHPSLYPYTDFYRKAYAYDHATGHFEVSGVSAPATPEVWHGVIVPPSKEETLGRQQLADYLYKNARYSLGDPEYADFDQRLMVADLPAMEEKLNILDYRKYEHANTYLEEMAFQRYNKRLLKHLIAQVSAELESDQPIMADEAIDALSDNATEFVFSKYAGPFADSLKTYLGRLNEQVEETGRWQTGQLDTPASLITMRDETMKSMLLAKSVELENEVNQAISQAMEMRELPTEVDVNIKLCPGGNCNDPVDDNTFTFQSYLQGQKVSTIVSAEQCSFWRGEPALEGESVLENNSIFVEANRTFNLQTSIIPEDENDTDPLPDRLEYKQYAGCVGNNSLTFSDPESGISLSPNFCQPDFAVLPVYDITGSHELNPAPLPPKADRCDTDFMAFHATDDATKLLNVHEGPAVEIIDPLANFVDGVVPVDLPGELDEGVLFSEKVSQVMAKNYSQLLASGVVTQPPTHPIQMANAVIRHALKTGEVFTYEVQADGSPHTIQLTVQPINKTILSLERHVEPTDSTIKAIKKNQLTPATPADGKRYVAFYKNSERQTFEYLNLFRIAGENPEQVAQNLIEKIAEKDSELNEKLESKEDVIANFFLDNLNLTEPIVWRNLGIDQKIELIQSKYLNRDSKLPTIPASPGEPQLPPLIKPKGYEGWHLRAEGDATGFEFGLHRAMVKQAGGLSDDDDSGTLATITAPLSSGPVDFSSTISTSSSSLCGDPTGVEIWEWFDAVQCWIENEILPAEKLFTLNNSCSVQGGIYDANEDEAAIGISPLSSTLSTPTQLDLTTARLSLTPGETVEIKTKALNNNGSEVIGYISDPLHLELNNPSLGTFSKNDFNLFTGEGKVTFTAQEVGSSTLNASLGSLEANPLQLQVLEQIHIKLSAEWMADKPSGFKVRAMIVDKNDQLLSDVDTFIRLTTTEPLAGVFQGKGMIHIMGGVGDALFFPSPKHTQMHITAEHPFYTADTIEVKPPANVPHALSIQAPIKAEVGEQISIPVQAVDINHNLSNAFTGSVQIDLADISDPFVELITPTISLQNGVGQVQVQIKNQTGVLKFTATHPQLESAKAQMPIIARVGSEEWAETFPQNLVASMLGFPAANVMEENYFAGAHLFSGKTQAVFGLMEAAQKPELIRLSSQYHLDTLEANQSVKIIPNGNNLGLYVMDQKNFETLLNATIPLDFTSVLSWEDADQLQDSTTQLWVDLDHSSYTLTPLQNALQIETKDGKPLLQLTQNSIDLIDFNTELLHHSDSDFSGLELLIRHENLTIGRLLLDFDSSMFDPANITLAPHLKTRTWYSGSGTNQPTGLLIYDHFAPAPEDPLPPKFGFEGETDFWMQFAGGAPIGEAVKYNLPPSAILLGDPTIQLKVAPSGSLNYDNTAGRKIFQDPEGVQVVDMTPFNFNNDEFEDTAMVMQDGRIRLIEGGQTDPLLQDQGDIAFIGDGAIAIKSLDLAQDGFDDLLVATNEGRLAILHNQNTVFHRTDHTLKVGKKLYKLEVSDMDQDGFLDLITLDSRGDLRIFYNQNGSLPENGKLIGNYGFSLSDGDLSGDLKIHFAGLSGEGGEDLPWPEGDNTDSSFLPIDQIDFLSVSKTVENKESPGQALDLEESLTYTITLTPQIDVDNVVLADFVPDALTLNASSVTCDGVGCKQFASEQNGILLFLQPLHFRAGKTITLTYEAGVKNTPQASFFIQKLTDPAIADAYLDILVSPPYNTTGMMIEHYSTAPREYAQRANVPQSSNSDDIATITAALGAADQCQQLVEQIGNIVQAGETPSQSLIDQMNEVCGMDEAQALLTEPQSCTPEEFGNDFVGCATQALNKTNQSISDFSCMGGGCFPSVYNQAFFVPDKAVALPLLSAPTTLFTAVGPVPFFDMFNAIAPVGATNIYGPINSMFRLYLSPTTTGGMAIAMCALSYSGDVAPPPPVFPIPYPPPLGNCIVQALPMGSMPVCKLIEETVTELMQSANSFVSDVNSEIAAINSDPNAPVNIQQSDESTGGAGGLEVSLDLNLGGESKFKPPAKGFSNTHVSAFDAIGGALSSWIDRQSLEMTQKLLTLPTFSILFPDFKSLVSSDFTQTEKLWEQFENSVTNQPTLGVTGEPDTFTQPLADLYAVANSLPMVSITERRVDFKIPWLSAAQIQDFIQDLERWGSSMEREWDRAWAEWSQFTCKEGWEQECKYKEIADMIQADIEPTLASIDANIEVLQSYLNLPRDLIAFKAQLADYIREISCNLVVLADMMGGWFATIQQQIVGYAEVVATIMEIVKRIDELFELFTDFNDSCDICTNERFADFGWPSLLGLVIPELPIIKFPKWPDIVLDISNLDSQMAIDLPMINFIPEPIQLPKLPIIRFPNVPTVNVLLQLPELPVLPALPKLPELPELPPVPTIQLPTLPPPPKLPDLGVALEVVVPLVEQILNMWCLLKKGYAPIPEGGLHDQITLMTNRPQYLIPLDLLKPEFPDVPGFELGFNELRIETTIYFGLRLAMVWEELQKGADEFNKASTGFADIINSGIHAAQDKIKKLSEETQSGIDTFEDILEEGASTVEGVGQEIQNEIDELEEDIGDEFSSIHPAERDFMSSEFKSLSAKWQEAKTVLTSLNENPVDYRIVKEKLGVPDVHLPPHQTLADQIHFMNGELLSYVDTLEAEMAELKKQPDLLALADQMPMRLPANQLVSSPATTEPTATTLSSNVHTPSSLLAQVDTGLDLDAFQGSANEAMASLTDQPHPTTTGCAGGCIVDLETNEKIQIPALDNPATAKTIFVKSTEANKSHILYSDGSSVYLKRDLTVPVTPSNNTPVPTRIFEINEFWSTPLMEAVNNLQADITKNKAANFKWDTVTHPDFYGYGISIKKSLSAFKNASGIHSPTVKIVLLPLDENGKLPQVLADEKSVNYGSILTSATNAEAVANQFGVSAKKLKTGVEKVTFPTLNNTTITLDSNTILLIDQYTQSSYELAMENAFYQAQMTWFDENGNTATLNHPEVLSPQLYTQPTPLIELPESHSFKVPQFKSKTFSAHDLFVDLGSAFEFGWDVNQDGLPDHTGDDWTLPKQKEPKTLFIDLLASQKLNDTSFPVQKKTIKITIYTPKIELDETALQDEDKITGSLIPQDSLHDVSDIPFNLFRKRWGVWKNLGQLKKKAETPTTPPLTQTNLGEHYYTQNSEGDYEITGLTTGLPSPVIIQGNAGELAARVHPGTGQIELLSAAYELKVLPASSTLPTRIAVLHKTSGQSVGNVYYSADANTDVTIRTTPLNTQNVASIGVTVGDANLSDDIIAANIPGFAPSFPGGVAIFNQTPPQINVALVDTDGAIRLMQEGYSLTLKNPGDLTQKPIFQIINATGDPVFDIFIKADFTSPEIHQDEVWGDLTETIGSLLKTTGPLLASTTPLYNLFAQAQPTSPFPDVPADHPNFKAILDLYEKRIIEGYGDGTFKPNAKITRAEFVKIALGVTNCADCSKPTDPQIEKYSPLAPFPDVKLPAWYYFCISIAKELGMVTGYGDGVFRPAQNISRAEAAAVLLRQSGIDIKEAPEQAFSDVADFAWYKDYVYTAVEIGLIKNNFGFVFPDEQITRAEFAFMASGLLNLQDCQLVDSDLDGMTDAWESKNNMDMLDSQDQWNDVDGDGLTALEEFQKGTDPQNEDSDGDGIPDAEDETPALTPPPPAPSTGSPGTSSGTFNIPWVPIPTPPNGIFPPGTSAPPGTSDTSTPEPAEPVCPCIDNPNQNDTDGDGLIDACDLDVDADGVGNALCMFNKNGLLDPNKTHQDNCPFILNPDQQDSDLDGFGNACEANDLCPTVPEDLDGVDDLDGCPEVNDQVADSPPGTYVNKGPLCTFLDYENDLIPGDVIMSVITDIENTNVIFEQSEEVNY